MARTTLLVSLSFLLACGSASSGSPAARPVALGGDGQGPDSGSLRWTATSFLPRDVSTEFDLDLGRLQRTRQFAQLRDVLLGGAAPDAREWMQVFVEGLARVSRVRVFLSEGRGEEDPVVMVLSGEFGVEEVHEFIATSEREGRRTEIRSLPGDVERFRIDDFECYLFADGSVLVMRDDEATGEPPRGVREARGWLERGEPQPEPPRLAQDPHGLDGLEMPGATLTVRMVLDTAEIVSGLPRREGLSVPEFVWVHGALTLRDDLRVALDVRGDDPEHAQAMGEVLLGMSAEIAPALAEMGLPALDGAITVEGDVLRVRYHVASATLTRVFDIVLSGVGAALTQAGPRTP